MASVTSPAKLAGEPNAAPRSRGRFELWLKRRRPAPLDVLTPAMQWGRFKTRLNAVLQRPQVLRASGRAWEIYEPVLKRLNVSWAQRPGDRIGRFAGHILDGRLPTPVRYLEIGSFEGSSVSFVHACWTATCGSSPSTRSRTIPRWRAGQ